MSDNSPVNKFDIPISVFYDTASGKLEQFEKLVERRLSDLAPMYYDQETVRSLVAGEDPLIYEIFYYSFPASKSDWGVGVSRIKPGTVGDEYNMTKGHFHEQDDQPEVYICTKGTGYLLMETAEGAFKAEEFRPGVVTHIPGHWSHRVVNTGSEDLSYIGVYSLSAGHVYDRVLERGYAQIIVERDGKPLFLPNPRRK
jgi:glucose-6-phosphate isomerase, archaeal